MASNQSLKVTIAKEWESKPLFSSRGHLLPVSVRVLPLLSPLLSRHRVLDSVQAGNFSKRSGKHIQWGHDRYKNFWHSRGYNFVSVKGMLLKLIQATILIPETFWIRHFYGYQSRDPLVAN